MKVLIKERYYFTGDRFKCYDIYREYFVDRAVEYSDRDMVELYKGGFAYTCVPKSDIIFIK